MSNKKLPLTDGYQPQVKKGYQPTTGNDGSIVKNGYQPPTSEGGNPTNKPAPPKEE